MAVKVVAPPENEPVVISDFKAWMRGIPVPRDQEDMINMLLRTGREEAEEYQNRAYCKQTLQIALDKPTSGAIILPRPPFKSLVSVVCYDASGEEINITDKFTINDIMCPAEIQMKDSESYPNITYRNQNPILITYIAGYDTIPEKVKQAILIHAAWSYMNPDGKEPVPAAFKSLLSKKRVMPL